MNHSFKKIKYFKSKMQYDGLNEETAKTVYQIIKIA
jgi:hypothetical protein